MSRKSWRPETIAVHTGVYQDGTWNSVTTPIYPSSTFKFDRFGVHRGFDYTRSGNPTRHALETNLAALEGGTNAYAFATGMAAMTAALMLLRNGDHIIAGRDIYGGTYRLLVSIAPRMGIEVSFVDQRDMDAVRAAVRPNSRAILIETPTNPLLYVMDIAALAAIAKEHGLLTIVDNTFLTPLLQRPFELGADVVVHSTTKYLNGHSDVVGGAVVVNDEKLAEQVAFLSNAMGLAQAPFDAWLVLRGVKTLRQRMEAHERNAMAVARFLEGHPSVKRVYYPGLESHPDHELAKRQQKGFGGMVSFDLNLEKVKPDELFSRLKLFLCGVWAADRFDSRDDEPRAPKRPDGGTGERPRVIGSGP